MNTKSVHLNLALPLTSSFSTDDRVIVGFASDLSHVCVWGFWETDWAPKEGIQVKGFCEDYGEGGETN